MPRGTRTFCQGWGSESDAREFWRDELGKRGGVVQYKTVGKVAFHPMTL